MSIQESDAKTVTEQKPTAGISRVIQVVKQRPGVTMAIVVILLLLLLWSPVIHPLWNNITYSDEGKFAGQPIYDWSENRISRTLHKDLENCGFNDGDIQEFLRVPNGSRTQHSDASGKLVASIYKDELTAGVFVIRISCAK